MSRERDEWPSRIKAIEREYFSVRLATDRLLSQAKDDPSILKGHLAFRDIGHAAANLESTYLIRLYAEFETGLRKYWESFKKTHPKTVDVIDSLSSKQMIPYDLTKCVHDVRNYRNSLVHERDDIAAHVTIGDARKHLCKYFARLPQDWA